jgi:hypothetical protein
MLKAQIPTLTEDEMVDLLILAFTQERVDGEEHCMARSLVWENLARNIFGLDDPGCQSLRIDRGMHSSCQYAVWSERELLCNEWTY